jgi:hypothetical protein
MEEGKEKWIAGEYKRLDERNMRELEERAMEGPPALPESCLPSGEYL